MLARLVNTAASMKGTEVSHKLRKPAVPIEKPQKPQNKAHQGTAVEEHAEKLVRIGAAGGLVVFRNESFNFIVHIVDGVVQIEFHLAHGRVIVGGTKNDHRDFQFIMCVNFAVNDKTV